MRRFFPKIGKCPWIRMHPRQNPRFLRLIRQASWRGTQRPSVSGPALTD
jgi:hypothetical protein